MSDPDEAEQTFPASDAMAHWAGPDRKTDGDGDTTTEGRSLSVTSDEPMIDPQDRHFGATAARDQDREERFEEEGVSEDEMPEEPAQRPRAGGKAEPAG